MIHMLDMTKFEDSEGIRSDYRGNYVFDRILKKQALKDPISEEQRRMIAEFPLLTIGAASVILIFYAFLKLEEATGDRMALG